LHQRLRELRIFKENPESALKLSRSFDGSRHGKDAGTLIAWRNGSGLRFATPKKGDEGEYKQVFSKMQELHALLGEPIMQVKDEPTGKE
jgi:hypothetical protein